jgi:hypothetical protein
LESGERALLLLTNKSEQVIITITVCKFEHSEGHKFVKEFKGQSITMVRSYEILGVNEIYKIKSSAPQVKRTKLYV